MGEMTASAIRTSKVLSNYSTAYKPNGFISEIVSPSVKVNAEVGIYYEFGREAFIKRDLKKAIGAITNQMTWVPSKSTFTCEMYAIEMLLYDRIVNQEDSPVRSRFRTIEGTKTSRLVNKEIRVSGVLRDYASIPNSGALDAGAKWSNYTSATSVPLTNIRTAKQSVFSRTFLAPTHIIIPHSVSEVLSGHPDVIDLVKYTDPSLLTDGGLPKRMFGLTVLEPASGYLTDESDTTPTEIWGDDVIVLYINPNPGLDTQNTMTTFSYINDRVRTGRMEKEEAEWFENAECVDEKLINANAAYIIRDVL